MQELKEESQDELALSREPMQVTVPVEMIRAKKNSGAAFTLACDASGLDDKEIYMGLLSAEGKPMDAGYFSNIKKGKATLQADLLADFCRVVGNTLYAEWLAYQVGCALVMVQTEAEKKLKRAEERIRQLELVVREMRAA